MTLQLISAAEAQCTGSNFPTVALRMEIYRDDSGAGVNAGANTETLHGKLMLIRRGTGGTGTYNSNANCSASASGALDTVAGNDTIWSSGGISYDFRSSSGHGANGYAQLLWEADFTVTHDTDGSKTFTYAGVWDSPGGDILGDTSVSGSYTLPTIVQVPTTPTSVAATRNSDALVTISWAQTNPGNGQPTSNGIRTRINGGAWSAPSVISPTTSVQVAASANQKLEYQVRASNTAGDSAWSSTSAAIYTTPAAPSAVVAAKDASLDINISWTPNAAYTEHEHVVEHSIDNGANWSTQATVASGTSTYKHVAPNAAQTHKYRVQSRSTTGALTSAWVESGNVALLVAPNKPTLPVLAAYAAKASAFVVPWTHNPVDTTPQMAYESAYSTNGGGAWTSTGKVTSTAASKSYAANTWTANQAVLFRVRTWGQAASGGSDGTGASPWSDTQTVTFKTAPVATITTPANASTYTTAQLVVALGFSQAESATFVQATVELWQGATLLETVVSGSLSGITFVTPVANAGSYTVKATVVDSNGVSSAQVTSAFSVSYTLPVAAGVNLTYLSEPGWVQIDLTIPTPGAGQAAATAVTITRTISGVTENVTVAYPIVGTTLTILDTIPTVRGSNIYLIRTLSAIGAIADVTRTLVTAEASWAFLSSGSGFADVVTFASNLQVAASPARSTALVEAAGRVSPIALFGTQESLTVSGSATIFADHPSTPLEIETFIRKAGRVCYRDPTGRRMFGVVAGSLDTPTSIYSGFQFSVTEAT